MLSIGAERVKARLQARGSLLRPGTLQAALQIDATDLTPGHKTKGSYTFDHSQLHAQLRNGVLTVPSFGCHSESAHIMGNALASAQGIFTVCRFIGDAEWRALADKFSNGMRIPHKSALFLPLDTPDRFYTDLHLRKLPGKPPEFHLCPKVGWRTLDSHRKMTEIFLTRELWHEELR